MRVVKEKRRKEKEKKTTYSSNPTVLFQPKTFSAFVGFPCSNSTSAGLYYRFYMYMR